MIGFILGVLPGGGAVMASLAAYATEKRIAKHPERFGRGAVEGVAQIGHSAVNAAEVDDGLACERLEIAFDRREMRSAGI